MSHSGYCTSPNPNSPACFPLDPSSLILQVLGDQQCPKQHAYQAYTHSHSPTSGFCQSLSRPYPKPTFMSFLCPSMSLSLGQIVHWLLFELGVNAYQRVDAGWKLCLVKSLRMFYSNNSLQSLEHVLMVWLQGALAACRIVSRVLTNAAVSCKTCPEFAKRGHCGPWLSAFSRLPRETQAPKN